MNATLLVISGPSGAGLGELVTALFARRNDLATVTPLTARKMKAGEVDGKGFYFYDLEGWNALKAAGDLLECTEFAGNDYGTSRRLVNAQLAAGKHVVLNLPVERAAQIKQHMPEALCVYAEPSPEVLRARLESVSRSRFEAEVRLEAAEQQRAASDFCDARLCTDNTEAALNELCALLDR